MKPEQAELVAPLAALVELRTRAMFGGLGLYHDGVFFGLVHGRELYLRVPPAARPLCRAAGSRPFEPPGGRPVLGTYWRVPAGVLRERQELKLWIERALADARQRGAGRDRR